MSKSPVVYLLANAPRGTLYIGVTSDLIGRVWQHRNNQVPGFTRKYGIHRLVYFEQHGDMLTAIEREKQLKKWRRDWKIRMVEEANPGWDDIWPKLF